VAEAVRAMGDNGLMSITVVGHGSVMATPDVLRLHIGVEVFRPTAVEALAAAAEAMSALRLSFDAGGVSAEDIRTADVTLRPHVLPANGGVSSTTTTYASSTILWVTIRDTGPAGQLIDSAIASIGDDGRIYGLSYAFADDEEAQTQARNQAFGHARAKAEQYARLAGLTLGDVISVTEGASGYGGYVTVATSRGAATDASSGQQVTTASVTVVFDAASAGG
jgi:uncharacterized protein YggE